MLSSCSSWIFLTDVGRFSYLQAVLLQLAAIKMCQELKRVPCPFLGRQSNLNVSFRMLQQAHRAFWQSSTMALQIHLVCLTRLRQHSSCMAVPLSGWITDMIQGCADVPTAAAIFPWFPAHSCSKPQGQPSSSSQQERTGAEHIAPSSRRRAAAAGRASCGHGCSGGCRGG